MAEDVAQRQAGAKANSTVENMRDAVEANGAAVQMRQAGESNKVVE